MLEKVRYLLISSKSHPSKLYVSYHHSYNAAKTNHIYSISIFYHLHTILRSAFSGGFNFGFKFRNGAVVFLSFLLFY